MTHASLGGWRPRLAALVAVEWLSLAAAPAFALMALLTGVFGGRSDMLCAVIQGTSVLSGMVPMYLLMSAFHAGPWLKLMQKSARKSVQLNPSS